MSRASKSASASHRKSRKIGAKRIESAEGTAPAGPSFPTNPFSKTWTSFPLIVVVALVIRVGFAFDYVRQNSRQALAVLPFLQESGNIAASLATGHGFSSPFRVDTGPTAWMPPVYPWLLSDLFRVFGVRTYESFLAATTLNILCSVLTCLPIYFAGRCVRGARIGATAGWLWAFFPNSILNTFESMWDASLGALLAATILWATLALDKSERGRDWCSYGLLWGIVLLTNTTLISLLPFLLGWLIYQRRKRRQEAAARSSFLKSSFASPALVLGIAILCCVPWTIRNYRVFHRFVPLRSTLGLQLWIGNNENPQEAWKEELHPIFNSAERQRYIRMGEIDYMNEKLREGIQFMLSHPGRDLQQFADRFIATWTGGTPSPVQDFIRTPGHWFRGVVVFNVLLALGAAGGILVLWKRRSIYLFPVAAFPVVFPWAYYLTLFVPRYRLPVDPAVMLLTAIALSAIFHRQGTAMNDNFLRDGLHFNHSSQEHHCRRGPARLAAAVYAASEGLDVLVVEAESPCGQAGSSSKIENYLGFPTGLSGQELAARAIAQTEKFGAKMMVAHGVVRLDCARRPYKVVLENGTELTARAVIIATGAEYKRPPIANLEQFTGQSVYYGAAFMEAQLCGDDEVIVVGGGNSAGQAAVFLSQTAKKVYMLVRSGGLAESMSRYLIQRIEENPAIELHYNTELVALEGAKQLERLTWRNNRTGETSVREIRHVFIMAGAAPRTEWLKGCVALDEKGFILTGRDLDNTANGTASRAHTRAPMMLETSLPGVFAVGDVRSGNVKRVASAVGEGSISILLVHRSLAEQ